MVYWETAHTVPNLPHFFRDWTRLGQGAAVCEGARQPSAALGRHSKLRLRKLPFTQATG
jgi:hypothetical protein